MPSNPTTAAEPESWATRAELLEVIRAELATVNADLGKSLLLDDHGDQQRIIRAMFTLDPDTRLWHRTGTSLGEALGDYAHQLKGEAKRTSKMNKRATAGDIAGVALKRDLVERMPSMGKPLTG